MTTSKLVMLAGVGLLCAALIGGFVARYAFSMLFNGSTIPNACLSEQWEDLPNVAGLRFEVEYKNCDTLAKDEAVSVYALETRPEAQIRLVEHSFSVTILAVFKTSGQRSRLRGTTGS